MDRVYWNNSITMLRSMIIDQDVKWPHAGDVTADTAANHTVSRQREEMGMEERGRACEEMVPFMVPVLFLQSKKINK